MSETPELRIRELVSELEQRFPYAAALLCEATGLRLRVSAGEQRASEGSPSGGVVFTIFDGQSFLEYATSDQDPEALAQGVRRWASRLAPRAGDVELPPSLALPSDEADASYRVPMERDPEHVPLTEKLALLRDMRQRLATQDVHIVQATAQYSEDTEHQLYIGRGRRLEQHVTRVVTGVMAVAAREGKTGTHFLSRGGTGGFELARIGDEQLAECGALAVRLMDATAIAPGEYAVVTDPSVSGVIAHECFGHGVELDLFPKGRARAAQYLDRRVAAPGVQMFDDPSVAGGYGSYFFDDEGEPARPAQILRDGILLLPISDLASATYAGGARTANGRRQDFTRKTYARMSNTFFAPGTTPPAELLERLGDGVYLRAAESGMEDPLGWGIQVTAHYAEEIRDGQPTGRLFAPVGISGYVPDLLQSIRAVGSDFELSPGLCGKGHKEMVPVASGGPHLLLKARLG